MILDDKTGLVLEGGGMRGIFTAGVLDCFMDRRIRFPYVIGVSAGASNGISYASGQRGRAKFSDIDLLKLRPYIGWKFFFQGKGFIDIEYLFGRYPQEYHKFDYDAYFRSPMRFVMVASDCRTGKAVYIEEKHDRELLLQYCRASCSLPFIGPIARVGGVPYLDGGICDSIPVARAMADGYEKNVIVLTRNKGYRKPDKNFALARLFYHKYPAIREQLLLRYRHYNEQLDLVERLEKEGKVVVIRPEKPIVVGRMDTDEKRLSDLYDEGYSLAEKALTFVEMQNTGEKGL